MKKNQTPSGQPTAKQEKRRNKLARKGEKMKQKLARKERILARKAARRQQLDVIAYRSLLEKAKAIALIEEILAGLRAGTVSVEHGDQKLEVTPTDVVDMRVRARRTFKNESIAIRLRWPRKAVAGKLPSLTISSAKPAQ